jgi:hypothetical protein
MRIQSSHASANRGLDAYWTCAEAIESLLVLEGDRMPRRLWDPACGMGHIVFPLQTSGRVVIASDIYDYGAVPSVGVFDYLTTPMLSEVEGVVTNPPYRQAQRFAEKALQEVDYVALLLRTNFLMDSARRGKWLDRCEPTRVWLSAQRLPFMHRYGWNGPRS